MLAMTLALAASAAWGSADFLGGRASRGLSALTVATFSKIAGATGLAVACVALGDLPSTHGLGWAIAAGVAGAAALVALYRALALGPMSLVAPLTACGAVVPVLVALAQGEAPGAVTAAGMACAFAGAVVVSRPPPSGAARSAVPSRSSSPHAAVPSWTPVHGAAVLSDSSAAPAAVPGMRRAAFWHALAAATGIGLVLTLLQQAVRAPEATALSVTLVAVVVNVVVLGVIAASSARVAAPPRAHVPAVVGCGLLDVTANVLFAQATADGSAAVVAVLGSLYPLGTVLLARAWLGERLSRSQSAGVAAAMAGVALIAVG